MIGGFNNGGFDLKLSIAKIKLRQIKVLYIKVQKRCPKTIVHALKLLKYNQHWLYFLTFISIIGLTDTQGGLVSGGREEGREVGRGEGGKEGGREEGGSYEKLQCTVHIQYTHMYMYLFLSLSLSPSSRFFIMVW